MLCLDLATGKVQWEKTVHRGAPQTPIHLKNSYGAETPVTDGERVYALFGNVGVFALHPRWQRGLVPAPRAAQNPLRLGHGGVAGGARRAGCSS